MVAIDTATVRCILNHDDDDGAKETLIKYEVDNMSVKTELITGINEEYQDKLDKKEVVRPTSGKVSNSNNKCPFCYKTFNKLSKTKIHMVRHTKS